MAAFVGMFVFVGSASAAATVIYNNGLTDPLPSNVPSEGVEAYSFKEFGGQVQFIGTERTNPLVTVMMSSWACQTGSWVTKDCASSDGATFNYPITLNVYNVNPDNSVGGLITTTTQSFDMPYRPSASSECGDGRWYDALSKTCFNGKAFPISFNLSGLTLPDKVIISVAYNTSHNGYTPVGNTTCNTSSGGCFYDSLNIGLGYPPNIGSDPVPDSIYQNATAYNYCNSELGTGTFRLDAGCWTGYQPTFKVEAESLPKVLEGKATGGLTLKGPRQQISFSAFDYGSSNLDEGTVEYQNFEYPGGLHYTTNILCANVKPEEHKAWFMFQIPEGFPGLSGLYVVSYVGDFGTPGTKGDVYGHAATSVLSAAQAWCEGGSVGPVYTVAGGNAVVHK